MQLLLKCRVQTLQAVEAGVTNVKCVAIGIEKQYRSILE